MPPLERKYGGSAKTRSTEDSGIEGEEIEAVALVEADVVLLVIEDGRREFDGGFGHGEVINQDR